MLTLHGGRVRGRRAVGRLDLPLLRLHAIARAAHEDLAAEGVVIWSLRYAVQGWNGTTASPVADAQWAIDQGFRVLAYSGDLWLYQQALRDGLAAIRKHAGQ